MNISQAISAKFLTIPIHNFYILISGSHCEHWQVHWIRDDDKSFMARNQLQNQKLFFSAQEKLNCFLKSVRHASCGAFNEIWKLGKSDFPWWIRRRIRTFLLSRLSVYLRPTEIHQWLMDSLFNVKQITFWLRVGVKFCIIVKLTDSNPHRDVSPAAQVADENHGDNISDLVARRNQAR